MKLLIATKNVHKALEIKAILKQLGSLDIFTLSDFPNYVPPEETGSTFEENAILKATHAAKELNMLTLADDSGLVVPALDGRPGVYSARYAGDHASSADNLKKLIGELKTLPEEKRFGAFECVMALADPDRLIRCCRAQCDGRLLTTPRGAQGFGYDPIFIKYDYNKTLAELKPELKNRISHRRKALDKVLLALDLIL